MVKLSSEHVPPSSPEYGNPPIRKLAAGREITVFALFEIIVIFEQKTFPPYHALFPIRGLLGRNDPSGVPCRGGGLVPVSFSTRSERRLAVASVGISFKLGHLRRGMRLLGAKCIAETVFQWVLGCLLKLFR